MTNTRLLQTATLLAKYGEIGNSNAIELLQIPHSQNDLAELLSTFDEQLTPEARSKLFLAMMAPLPLGVENQRYEPIFDRHPLSGRTYTTASGAVVPNEVQYYNGEMVQFYGECTNVSAVRDALAGSGYKPMTLRYADGRETALAHFWAHNLSDTSLRPYNAIFIIAIVVRDTASDSEASLRANDNGASSVLSVLDGSFDAARAVYENTARFFFLRLLDSTRVAIEVGRERMGTDKRRGTIDLSHLGKQVTFVVKDGDGRSVAKITVTPADDPTAYDGEVARAAATAGVSLRDKPPGTEFVYPCVARIGNGPVLSWQWRSDIRPRLQRVAAGSVVFDSSSEEGRIMIDWGFRPTVLGYLPIARGVVTGIPETSPRSPVSVPFVSTSALPALRPKWL